MQIARQGDIVALKGSSTLWWQLSNIDLACRTAYSKVAACITSWVLQIARTGDIVVAYITSWVLQIARTETLL